MYPRISPTGVSSDLVFFSFTYHSTFVLHIVPLLTLQASFLFSLFPVIMSTTMLFSVVLYRSDWSEHLYNRKKDGPFSINSALQKVYPRTLYPKFLTCSFYLLDEILYLLL